MKSLKLLCYVVIAFGLATILRASEATETRFISSGGGFYAMFSFTTPAQNYNDLYFLTVTNHDGLTITIEYTAGRMWTYVSDTGAEGVDINYSNWGDSGDADIWNLPEGLYDITLSGPGVSSWNFTVW